MPAVLGSEESGIYNASRLQNLKPQSMYAFTWLPDIRGINPKFVMGGPFVQFVYKLSRQGKSDDNTASPYVIG